MKKTLLLTLGCGLLLALACTEDNASQGGADTGNIPPKGGEEINQPLKVTSFEEYGMPLKMEMADPSLPEPSVNLNGNFGRLEVRIDQDLAFNIVTDQRDIGEIKDELQQDDVFDYVFFDEGEDRLMYQAKLPTGKVVGHYFMRSLEVGGERYLVATDEQLELSHYEARRAASVINSLAAVR